MGKSRPRNARKPTRGDPTAADPRQYVTWPTEEMNSEDRGYVGPSGRVRRIVSVALSLHLFGLVVALASNLSPSYLQGEINAWLAPYHVTTAQDYLLLPLELTHGTSIDAPLRLEIRWSDSPRSDGDGWQPVNMSLQGMANFSLANSPTSVYATRRATNYGSRWSNYCRFLRWVVDQEPDSVTVAECLAQVVRRIENSDGETRLADSPNQASDSTNQTTKQIVGIRLVQPPVLTFDEDLQLSTGELAPEAVSDEVVYAANVIRFPSGEIGLVPDQTAAMTAKPRSRDTAGESSLTPPRTRSEVDHPQSTTNPPLQQAEEQEGAT